MERAPAGSGIILELVQRAASGDTMSDEDVQLWRAVPHHVMHLWLTRFHNSVLTHDMHGKSLREIDMFTRRWPKHAITISKEVGWPDENH